MNVNLQDVGQIVRTVLLGLELPGIQEAHIQPHRELIMDLGLDSLKFVDLTVALEHALGVEEFPMQAWVDARIASNEPLTVASLERACEAALLAPCKNLTARERRAIKRT